MREGTPLTHVSVFMHVEDTDSRQHDGIYKPEVCEALTAHMTGLLFLTRCSFCSFFFFKYILCTSIESNPVKNVQCMLF